MGPSLHTTRWPPPFSGSLSTSARESGPCAGHGLQRTDSFESPALTKLMTRQPQHGRGSSDTAALERVLPLSPSSAPTLEYGQAKTAPPKKVITYPRK